MYAIRNDLNMYTRSKLNFANIEVRTDFPCIIQRTLTIFFSFPSWRGSESESNSILDGNTTFYM